MIVSQNSLRRSTQPEQKYERNGNRPGPASAQDLAKCRRHLRGRSRRYRSGAHYRFRSSSGRNLPAARPATKRLSSYDGHRLPHCLRSFWRLRCSSPRAQPPNEACSHSRCHRPCHVDTWHRHDVEQRTCFRSALVSDRSRRAGHAAIMAGRQTSRIDFPSLECIWLLCVG